MTLEINKIHNMDCLEGMKQLKDNSVDLIVTSPPYNIGIDYGSTYEDKQTKEEYSSFMKKVYSEMFRIIKPKGICAVVVGNQRESGIVHDNYYYLKDSGFQILKEIIWYKGLYYIRYEMIFVCSKTGEYNNYYKKNDGFYSNGQFATIWEMRYGNGESKDKLKHNAFFVEELPKRMIMINTKEGDLVLDPFVGSGTTCKMAKLYGRNFLGFEINPEYVKISNRRLE